MNRVILFLTVILWAACSKAETGDTLHIRDIADSVRTITVRCDKHLDAQHVVFYNLAIGQSHLFLGFGWGMGCVYSMDDGHLVRRLNGGKKYSDCLFAGTPALDPSSVTMAGGDDFYARGCYEEGMEKKLYIVRGALTDSLLRDSIHVNSLMALRIAGNSVRYAQNMKELYNEYCLPAETPNSVRETGRWLWLIYRNQYMLYDKAKCSSRTLRHFECDGAVLPIKFLIGFGPQHVAFVQPGEENEIKITLCRLK